MSNWPISARLREYLEVQYELRRVLGEGGMGVVLLASERVLDRLVAIKVLHRHAAEQPELRERFRREARVAARLAHPNIVPLHAFGDVDGELFFVMGYVEGETLAALLKREHRLAQDVALRILREVCDALAFAHAGGVVHRDIKPDNVLIEARTGRTLLADFGIAREGTASTALTGTGIVVGTPQYMSPEQAVSEGEVDHRSDIYAVGVMGYRMLSGRLPFDGANVREILARQMVATPRNFANDDPAISPGAAAALMRCLEKDPARRWPDATSLREALVSPRGDVEDLPDDVATHDGAFTKLAFVALPAIWFWVLNELWWTNDLLAGLLPIPIIGAPLMALAVSATTARKHGLRRMLKLMARPPRWWPLWWPKFGRRPGDVWDRLPKQLRTARALLFSSLAIGALVISAPLLLMLTLPPERLAVLLANPFFKPGVGAVALLMTACSSGAALMAYVWSRKAGISAMAASTPSLLGEPTASPRWKRVEAARILLPEAVAGPGVPDSVERLGAAIGEDVRLLVDGGVIPSGAPGEVAREVVAAIAAIDREIDMLAKGGDEAELKRLDARIEGLVPGGVDSGIAEMLGRQRDAVAAIVRRQEEQRQRRERLAARLRELFVALEDVRRRANAEPAAEITGRLDAVCGDLRRLAAGYDEVRGESPRTS